MIDPFKNYTPQQKKMHDEILSEIDAEAIKELKKINNAELIKIDGEIIRKLQKLVKKGKKCKRMC
jgi:hypothetical protein